MLKEYNHKISGNNPGSEWKTEEKDKIIHPDHLSTVGNLLSDNHYDVFVRYGYADALVNGNMDGDYKFWKKFYEKMQNQRVGTVKIDEFDRLIRNFEKNGFENDKSLPVDENYEILDGSHRLACSALFEVYPRVSVYNTKSHAYDRAWFVSNGFSEEELKQADKVKSFLLDKYKDANPDSYVAIVWGMALEYWEDIFTHLEQANIRRAFIRDYKDQIERFIMQSYENDGMNYENIIKKARKLSDQSSRAGLIILDNDLEKINVFKKEIREKLSTIIENYFFDCILHVIDDQTEGLDFYDKYKINK